MANDIQAVADYRGSFEPGMVSTVFLKTTLFDGTAIDPSAVNVSIVNDLDEEQAGGIPEKVVTGFYVFDWSIPSDQPSGTYTVKWTYQDGSDSVEELQYIVVAGSSSHSGTSLYDDRISGMRMALSVHLSCAQAVPVYKEQGIIESDNKTVSFNFPRWNQNQGTRIFVNEKPVRSGLIINYFKGQITFDSDLTEFDTVTADYNFRWFDDESLDRFMQNALSIVNSYPPVGRYNLYSVPDRFIPHIMYGATKDAIRHMLMCLQFQEPQEVFGGPDKAQTAFQQLETLKQNYEKDFRDLLEQKKKGPYTGLTKGIVVPEYTLPGGRSRWFRYLFKSGGGA